RFVDRISDWRSWAHSIATEHLSAVPVAGAGWDWAMGKLFDQDVFDRNANVMVTTTQKTMREAGKLFDDEQRTIEQNVESGIRLIQSLGSLIPGGASAAQLGNVADFIYGTASSNDFLISDQD